MMQPTVYIVTFGQFDALMREEIQNTDFPINICIHNILLSHASPLPGAMDVADVFLSSGYNAHLLKEKTSKPVITMEPSVYDLLRALTQAKEYDENPLVLSFGHAHALLSGIEDILKFTFEQDIFSGPDNIDEAILKHKKRGGKCIIASALGCARAEALGMKSVFIYPQEAAKNYLQVAVETAITLEREQCKTRQLSAIVNNSNSGILLTDQNGTVIVCNPVGQSFFSSECPNVKGMPLEAILSGVDVQGLLAAKFAARNIVCAIGSTQYLVDAFPILVRGDLANLLITISDISAIQKAEHHIRKSLMRKGFLAKHHFEQYNTSSPRFRKLIDTAKRFSQSDEAIVILGETGSGKEIMAQCIHNNSKRAKHAFVAVNCSAINVRLLESELFGYEEGAFTGARKGGKEGLFELAHQGTIFLDEIGEIGPEMQSKLLRVIQEKEVMRVGGTRVIPFDARIITATNQRLWELVQSGKFREDLYYRINVLELHLPPLRARREDIFPLFNTFMKEALPGIDKSLNKIAHKMGELLCSYSWPGNIRELQNMTKMLLATVDAHPSAANLYDLVAEFIQDRKNRLERKYHIFPYGEEIDKFSEKGHMPPRGMRISLNQKQIAAALQEFDGNQSKAAAALGISRVTLWRKIRQYKIPD